MLPIAGYCPVKGVGEGEMMIANFDKLASATSESGVWTPCSSLVERVCSFLERYPFLQTNDENIAPSVTLCRTPNDRGQR
jgi:hypothetical protein